MESQTMWLSKLGGETLREAIKSFSIHTGIHVDSIELEDMDDKTMITLHPTDPSTLFKIGREYGIVIERQKNKEMQEFLFKLHDNMKSMAGKSSYGDTYYVMWNEEECIGDVIRRLIGLPKLNHAKDLGLEEE